MSYMLILLNQTIFKIYNVGSTIERLKLLKLICLQVALFSKFHVFSSNVAVI